MRAKKVVLRSWELLTDAQRAAIEIDLPRVYKSRGIIDPGDIRETLWPIGADGQYHGDLDGTEDETFDDIHGQLREPAQ